MTIYLNKLIRVTHKIVDSPSNFHDIAIHNLTGINLQCVKIQIKHIM